MLLVTLDKTTSRLVFGVFPSFLHDPVATARGSDSRIESKVFLCRDILARVQA